MIDKMLEEENILQAIEFMAEKGEQSGLDGIKLKDAGEYWEINKKRISEEIKNGVYRCTTIEEYQIIGKKGKKRWIAKFNSMDRVLFRALYQVLEPIINPKLSAHSFAFVSGLGIGDAVEEALEYIKDGFVYIVSIDIESYFDNIPHDLLLNELYSILDDTTVNFIKASFECRILRDNELYIKKKGVLQGNPVSPLIANYYLHDIDEMLEAKNIKFIRYADDLKIFVRNEEEGIEIKTLVSEALAEKRLSLNLFKTKISYYENIEMLGYKLIKNNNSNIIAQRCQRSGGDIYREWTRSIIPKTEDTYYITTDGILTVKEYSLLFENEECKMAIPPNSTNTINVYSNIVFSSNYFKFLNSNGITLNIFDKFGEFVGSFSPCNSDSQSETSVKQMQIFCDSEKHISIARKIEIAAAHNIRANLRYYYKNYSYSYIAEAINDLGILINEIKKADSINALLIIEARIREKYYSCFNYILDGDDFNFDKRTRQPPLSAINALISFGNTLLYQRIATEIRKSSLDIRIGFIHTPNRRKEALHLDIAEIFKPIITDRVIFSLINKRVLNEALDFMSSDNGGIYLNSNGKRVYISAFNKKLYEKITVSGKSVSYMELIRYEIKKLIDHINSGNAYLPYKYY